MAIPEHVKKQAQAAVSYRDTTAKAWLSQNASAAQHSSQLFTPKPNPRHDQPITPEVGKQARDTVNTIQNPAQGSMFQSRDMQAMIKLVAHNGPVAPMGTPSHGGNRAAEKIMSMQKSGQGADAIHRAATRDNFARVA